MGFLFCTSLLSFSMIFLRCSFRTLGDLKGHRPNSRPAGQEGTRKKSNITFIFFVESILDLFLLCKLFVQFLFVKTKRVAKLHLRVLVI